ncbi:MAG: hypothetical protein CL672_06075 [Balneola sp.]|nr:hypothetical protein [Balneola sp.]|tara:strand:- start:257 stop:505 length:249 start_codon:yes stop_codon:yes gene_type:complete
MFQDSTDVTPVDTLSQVYSDKWITAVNQGEGLFASFMSSNNLIFVVLGVTLIIWTVLIVYLTRVDKRVTMLENKLNNLSNEA